MRHIFIIMVTFTLFACAAAAPPISAVSGANTMYTYSRKGISSFYYSFKAWNQMRNNPHCGYSVNKELPECKLRIEYLEKR